VIELFDDLGRAVRLRAPARRIVSLVPSLTETLFALGCNDRVVGATRYCTEPRGWVERLARIGGTKNPDLARIAALQPDLVLINPEENRRADFEALEAAGLTLCVVFPRGAGDVPAMLRLLGQLTATQAAADARARDVAAALAECESMVAAPRLRVFCPIWKNPWMSFNRDTYSDDMLWRAGGANIYRAAGERYCSVRLEDVAQRMPEVILLPDEPYVFREKDRPALRALALTPAWRSERVYFIDGKALTWYGARTAAGLRTLRRLLGRRR
jgi:ABC-type Fe3+-hydroxamate transport system substrate-binding protein